jgi:hypothetical protein
VGVDVAAAAAVVVVVVGVVLVVVAYLAAAVDTVCRAHEPVAADDDIDALTQMTRI